MRGSVDSSIEWFLHPNVAAHHVTRLILIHRHCSTDHLHLDRCNGSVASSFRLTHWLTHSLDCSLVTATVPMLIEPHSWCRVPSRYHSRSHSLSVSMDSLRSLRSVAQEAACVLLGTRQSIALIRSTHSLSHSRVRETLSDSLTHWLFTRSLLRTRSVHSGLCARSPKPSTATNLHHSVKSPVPFAEVLDDYGSRDESDPPLTHHHVPSASLPILTTSDGA